MKKAIVLIIILSVSVVSAQTDIPAGYVSGTWTADGSPYLIQGNITVHADSALNIDPGVVIDFQGNYSLTVNGLLDAIGAETDSIHFMRSNGNWSGIFFSNAPDTSHVSFCTIRDIGWVGIICQISNPVISHCTITGAGWGIWVYNISNPSISHCDISYNYHGIEWGSTASGIISDCIISHNIGAGGIFLNGGNLTFVDCIIRDNTNEGLPGGGVRSDYGTLTLINCTISNNTTTSGRGGGVACYNGSATIINCTINGNYAYDLSAPPFIGGGGISLYYANAILSYCTIFDNFGVPGGGGISIDNGSNLSVDHCTIDGNTNEDSGSPGAGIRILGSSATAEVTNSIISNNHWYHNNDNGYGIYNQGTLTVEFSDFFNNGAAPISGNIPTGFGELIQVNPNSDSCDVYYNIFLDPIYVDPDNGDYHLQEGSSCIDAGNPDLPYDPDSTITDMGAFYFDQPTGIDDTPSIPAGFVLSQNYPNPFNAITSIKYNLAVASDVSIDIYDILGRKVETLIQGEQPAGYHSITWDASETASGMYFYKIKAGEFVETRKMVLLK